MIFTPLSLVFGVFTVSPLIMVSPQCISCKGRWYGYSETNLNRQLKVKKIKYMIWNIPIINKLSWQTLPLRLPLQWITCIVSPALLTDGAERLEPCGGDHEGCLGVTESSEVRWSIHDSFSVSVTVRALVLVCRQRWKYLAFTLTVCFSPSVIRLLSMNLGVLTDGPLALLKEKSRW